LHVRPGTGGFMSPAVMLPLQPDEVIREPLCRLSRLGGELVGRGIIDRSGRGHDLVNATQEEASLSQERLCLLSRLGRGDRPLVSERIVPHGDSVPLSHQVDESAFDLSTSRLLLRPWGPARLGGERATPYLRRAASAVSREGLSQLGLRGLT
jgi:hypothetical protein